jgi:riboflavin kinase/FMN adenylyltransferase
LELRIFTNLEKANSISKPVLTTGTFDGVHLGHRKIIDRLNSATKKNGGESTLFTFSEHPRMVLHPEDHGLELLNTRDEKFVLLENAGLQNLIIHPFTEDFSRLSATEYVRDILVGKIGVSKLIVGYDHHFGRNREGDFNQLQEFSSMYQFDLEEIPAHEVENCQVSSTKIRQALNEGQVLLASKLLGYPYQLSGKIVKGDQLGRKFGFPTANLAIEEGYKLIPSNGVYAVRVYTNGKQAKGMMNIGYKPTVSSSKQKTIEVHIFDWQQDIYGEEMKVEFIDRIREEIKFDSKDQLIARLHIDRTQAESILA